MGNAFYDSSLELSSEEVDVSTSSLTLPTSSSSTLPTVRTVDEIWEKMRSSIPIHNEYDRAIDGPTSFLTPLHLSYLLTQKVVPMVGISELSKLKCNVDPDLFWTYIRFENAAVDVTYRCQQPNNKLLGCYIVLKITYSLTALPRSIYNGGAYSSYWRADGPNKTPNMSSVPTYTSYSYKDHSLSACLQDTLNKLVVFHNPDNTSLLIFYHNTPIIRRR